jgi:hypothetical protein
VDLTFTFLGACLALVVGMLCQAVVLHGALQDMRGRRVSLIESLQPALRRFFPIIALAALVPFCAAFGIIFLIVPGLIVLTVWFVAMPVCIVEKLGPYRSVARSTQLTDGHGWKVFGLMLLITGINYVLPPVIGLISPAVAGSTLAFISSLVWNAAYYAFYAIAVAVTYHDLRVAKEGLDIEQIAAVFN